MSNVGRQLSKYFQTQTNRIDVRPICLVTVSDRSFSTAGPMLWNSLPNDTTSAPLLPVFRRKLKTCFSDHTPDIVIAL